MKQIKCDRCSRISTVWTEVRVDYGCSTPRYLLDEEQIFRTTNWVRNNSKELCPDCSDELVRFLQTNPGKAITAEEYIKKGD